MCLYLIVPWVGLHYVNVAFPGRANLLFAMLYMTLDFQI